MRLTINLYQLYNAFPAFAIPLLLMLDWFAFKMDHQKAFKAKTFL